MYFFAGISSAIARHSHALYPALDAIDGNVNSFFHYLEGGPTPMWFQADLGSSKVREVNLRSYSVICVNATELWVQDDYFA